MFSPISLSLLVTYFYFSHGFERQLFVLSCTCNIPSSDSLLLDYDSLLLQAIPEPGSSLYSPFTGFGRLILIYLGTLPASTGQESLAYLCLLGFSARRSGDYIT